MTVMRTIDIAAHILFVMSIVVDVAYSELTGDRILAVLMIFVATLVAVYVFASGE